MGMKIMKIRKIRIKYFKALFPNVHMESYVFFHPKGCNKVFYGSINKEIVLVLSRKDAEAWPETNARSLDLPLGKFWVRGPASADKNKISFGNEIFNRLKKIYHDQYTY